ncbi:hypothetical protein CP967_18500 [Streptomyces nitrosporeus]|uniref:Uncharacterized protein n=1 Tax=Streptomyces nitrosporeus TaxID=28894 RepID=A0A5J6FC29_9ACTN|nr:hypothetical protein CP967_18500 [Streptomyces nitrosporeus]
MSVLRSSGPSVSCVQDPGSRPGDRQSVPSLIMTSRELAAEMRRRYSSEPAARDYLTRLHSLAGPSPFVVDTRSLITRRA